MVEQYREQGYGKDNSLTNIDVVGYEIKFIGDRIFNYK